MTEFIEENKTLMEYLKALNMPSIKEYIEDIEKQAYAEQWTYRQFLSKLMEAEVHRRAENRKAQRLRQAGFPEMKYLQELERTELPAECRTILPELETLNFIREGRNIVMYGNPGTGKTHTAIGLGIKACMEGPHCCRLSRACLYPNACVVPSE